MVTYRIPPDLLPQSSSVSQFQHFIVTAVCLCVYKLAKLILVLVWVVAGHGYSTLNINAGEYDK